MKNLLRQKRESLGLIKTQVADRANISLMSYSRYERSQRIPNAEICQRLALALNAKVDEIFPLD